MSHTALNIRHTHTSMLYRIYSGEKHNTIADVMLALTHCLCTYKHSKCDTHVLGDVCVCQGQHIIIGTYKDTCRHKQPLKNTFIRHPRMFMAANDAYLYSYTVFILAVKYVE